MIPGALWGGGAMMIGGQIMSGIGEYQGTRALVAEKERQLRDTRMSDEERNALVRGEIDHNVANPVGLRMAANTAANLGARVQASTSAAKAGAAALGVNPSAAPMAVQGMMPGMRMQAGADGAGNMQAQNAIRRKALAGGMSEVDQRRQLAQALWAQREQVAAMTGQGLRQAGGLMNMGGQMTMMAGMAGSPAQSGVSTSVPAGGESLGAFDPNIHSGVYNPAGQSTMFLAP